jgi:hypothetical protein
MPRRRLRIHKVTDLRFFLSGCECVPNTGESLFILGGCQRKEIWVFRRLCDANQLAGPNIRQSIQRVTARLEAGLLETGPATGPRLQLCCNTLM